MLWGIAMGWRDSRGRKLTKDAEREPLISSSSAPSSATPSTFKPTTPLPVFQLFVLCSMRLGEPIAQSIIYPFVIRQVTESGITHDPKRVGYYAGMIDALFALCIFLTVLPWGRLSDRIGRKPVLLCGMAGTMISTVGFGLSKSFWAMLFARCLGGALNGNVAVIKSIMSEITDETNQARAFSFIPLSWSIGLIIGPLLGGYLSNPADNFPSVFGNSHFFKHHPYALPCFISGAFSLAGAVLCATCLNETLPSQPKEVRPTSPIGERSSHLNPRPLSIPPPDDLLKTIQYRRKQAFLHRSSITEPVHVPSNMPSRAATPTPKNRNPLGVDTEVQVHHDTPPPVSDLFIPRIFCILIVYAFLSLTSVSLDAILVLLCSTAVDHGGLGFTAGDLGRALSCGGFLTITVQLAFFPYLQRRWGTLNLYKTMLSLYPVTFLLLPLMAILVTKDEGTERGKTRVWQVMFVFLFVKSCANMSYGANMIAINDAVPSRRLLGSMNGLGQTVSSLMRATGSILASSLFAYSITHTVADGFLVFWVYSGVAVMGWISSFGMQKGPSWRDEHKLVEDPETGVRRIESP